MTAEAAATHPGGPEAPRRAEFRQGWALLATLCAAVGAAAAWALEPQDSTTGPPAPQELAFLTWSDYIDPEVVKDFERRFNASVKQVYFETDDARDDLLSETEGRGYDVVVVNGSQMEAYVRRGWVGPLTEKDVPNLRYVDTKWVEAVPSAVGHGVPYFWGTLGIAYRADLVPEQITSWKQIFQPPQALKGKIVMVKNARDVIGMALKASGYSANSTEVHALAQAEHLLAGQKPYVRSYSYVALNEHSELVSGKILAAMIYSGDALVLKERDPNIVYVVPKEGSNLWVDYLTVTPNSARRQLAAAFINFLQEPKNAARLALFVHYATPNREAEKLLPADFLKDPVIYPSQEVLRRCEFYTTLTPRALKIRNRIFASLLQ
jgi:spermidine/putrescine transport system substrate-binding protein